MPNWFGGLSFFEVFVVGVAIVCRVIQITASGGDRKNGPFGRKKGLEYWLRDCAVDFE
jgi:hypothetical protein